MTNDGARHDWRVHADRAAVVAAALERVLEHAERACAARGRFDLALSGGSTPRPLYRALTKLAPATFGGWHFWMGDERFVPADHPDNNFRAFAEDFLDAVAVDAGRLHPVPVASASAAEAARRYEAELTGELGGRGLDLCLMGMGSDGHTASLFPGTPVLAERERLVSTSVPPDAPHERVTLTFPALARSGELLFLVCGADKRPALERIAALPAPSPALPASMARSATGATVWLLDRAAWPSG